MLKPYLFGAVISLCLYWVAFRLDIDTSAARSFDNFNLLQIALSTLKGYGGGATWYLYSFGIIEILVLLAIRFRPKDDRLEILWIISTVSAFSILLSMLKFCVVIRFLPFFWIGYTMKRGQMEIPFSWLFGVPALVLVLSPNMNWTSYVNVIWVICIWGLLTWFAEVLERKVQPVSDCLAFLGRHTLSILLFHNIFSVGLRPYSKFVLMIEPSGVFLNVLLCGAIIAFCLFAEWCINKTPVRRFVWESK